MINSFGSGVIQSQTLMDLFNNHPVGSIEFRYFVSSPEGFYRWSPSAQTYVPEGSAADVPIANWDVENDIVMGFNQTAVVFLADKDVGSSIEAINVGTYTLNGQEVQFSPGDRLVKIEGGGFLYDPRGTLTVQGISENEIPMVTGGMLTNSGLQIIGDIILAKKRLRVQNNTLDVGNSASLIEVGAGLAGVSQITDNVYMIPYAQYTEEAGTLRPIILRAVPGTIIRDVQVDDDSQVMINPDFRILPEFDTLVNRIKFRVNKATNNVVLRVTSNGNGKHVKYLPDEAAWLAVMNEVNGGDAAPANTGFDIVVGDNVLDVSVSPFAALGSFNYDIQIKLVCSEGVELLGDGTTPYMVVEGNDIELAYNPYTDELADILNSLVAGERVSYNALDDTPTDITSINTIIKDASYTATAEDFNGHSHTVFIFTNTSQVDLVIPANLMPSANIWTVKMLSPQNNPSNRVLVQTTGGGKIDFEFDHLVADGEALTCVHFTGNQHYILNELELGDNINNYLASLTFDNAARTLTATRAGLNPLTVVIPTSAEPHHDAFLAEVTQEGTEFTLSENVAVNANNINGEMNMALNVPLTSDPVRLANIGGSTEQTVILEGFSELKFDKLIGGKLILSLACNAETIGGNEPQFVDITFTYGSRIFVFPIDSLSAVDGHITVPIDIPFVDYEDAIDISPTVELRVLVTGFNWLGTFTVNSVMNILKGNLHDSVDAIALLRAQEVQQNIESQLTQIKGDISGEAESISDVSRRASPEHEIPIATPEIDARYLDSTGSDNTPTDIGQMTQVSAENPIYTMGTAFAYIAVIGGLNYTLKNITQDTEVALTNATVVSSLDGYFIHDIKSGLNAGDMIEIERVTFSNVLQWPEDIKNLQLDVERLDAIVDNAALNIPPEVVDVLAHKTSVEEEENPSIVASEYNKSLGDTGNQIVFLEPIPNTPSSGVLNSNSIKDSEVDRQGNKLLYLNQQEYSIGSILSAFDGVNENLDLVTYRNGKFYAKVFVPAIPAGSRTETIYPAPANKVSGPGIWHTIPALTFVDGIPVPEADELFFVRNIPDVARNLVNAYRGHANGNLFGDGQITLSGFGGANDVVNSVVLDDGGEQATLENRYYANFNGNKVLRESVTERLSSGLATINDVQVLPHYEETRTVPATPATTRDVELINIDSTTGRDTVFATKVDSGKLVIVCDSLEINTNYDITTLFGNNLDGYLTAHTQQSIFYDYQDIDIIDNTVMDLENHSVINNKDLFNTIYTHATILDFGTQLKIRGSDGTVYNVGEILKQLLEA